MSFVAVFLLAQASLGVAAPSPKCDPFHPPGPYDVLNPNLGLSEEPGTGGCPTGMARVAGFCIDRYEGSLLEVRPDGSAWYWSPYHNPGDRRVRAVSLAGAVPQGYISGKQAQAACVEAGKRLCTDEEWVRACRGREWTEFPYGGARYPVGSGPNDPPCNESRAQHPAVELFPHDPKPFSHLDNACINQLEKSVARSGSFSRCVSEDGIYDLMGNLHEWTSNAKGAFRGGFYVDTRINREGCLYVTTAHSPRYWDYSTGFRCCAEPLSD
ncbi:MAG: SUMF1/EgtB/PvdO family nonheme iron enzyme [Deltaproteobacteria bacterium]|nr:SUMF1/EgtB/PvdO family nonheme iron enzyme [Deltaproteobacteria bacterium]